MHSTPEGFSQTVDAVERLKKEIDKLTEVQSTSLEMATHVGMTPDEAKEYDERRQRISQHIQELAMLEESL